LLAEILVEKTTALGMVKYIRCVLWQEGRRDVAGWDPGGKNHGPWYG